ncbi:MAG: CBS domain-containing protein [Thermoprotei archaeon]|nr:MAG: CBS domain-containing protein [Thermoprotei archaeon]
MVAIALRSIQVKDVMTRRIITIESDRTVHEAARKMARARVSTIIVVEGGEPVGIITDSDIIKKVVAKNLRPSSVRVKEIMSSPIIYVTPEADLEEVKDVMVRRKIRRLPVVSDGKLVGIVTVSDIARLCPEVLSLVKPRTVEQVLGEPVSGICERCYNYSDDLRLVEGQWLCPECRADLGLT